MDEQTIIKTSIIEIFNDNGYSNLATLAQRDFDYIGEQLKQKSGILISGTPSKLSCLHPVKAKGYKYFCANQIELLKVIATSLYLKEQEIR